MMNMIGFTSRVLSSNMKCLTFSPGFVNNPLIVYITWAIGHFFDKKKAINYVKSFASYILGMISFMLSALLLGTIIDLIIKH